MARGFSTVGVFNDLSVGEGNYVHSDSTWVGDTTTPGVPSVDTILYNTGDVVFHNSILWVALRSNDNVEPSPVASLDWAQASSGAAVPEPVMVRLVVNFVAIPATVLLDNVPVIADISFDNDTIALVTGGTIADDAEVEVNGIQFFPLADFTIVAGLLTFNDFDLVPGTGDLILITYAEAV